MTPLDATFAALADPTRRAIPERLARGGEAAAEAAYREVVPPRRIVLAWTWAEGPAEAPPDGATSLVTFDIAPDDAGDGPGTPSGTRLTLTHAGLPDAGEVRGHQEGWTEALEKLATLIDTETR